MNQLPRFMMFAIYGVVGLFFSGLNAQTRHMDTLYPVHAIQVIENIDYHTHDRSIWGMESMAAYLGPEWKEVFSRTLKADLYLPPRESTSRRPLIVFCHPGFDLLNHKAEKSAVAFAYKMAQRGFAVVSINYRHAAFGIQRGVTPYYLAAQDVSIAARFFAQHAHHYGIDPQAIIYAGEGLGATAAMHAAFWNPRELRGVNAQDLDEYYGGIHNQGPEMDAITPVSVINIGGGILDTLMLQNESVPVLSIHGTLDYRIRFNFGVPQTSFANSLFYYWSQLKKMVPINKDPALFSRRLPLYGSNLIHLQLAAHSPHSQLVPMYGERDHLITSRVDNNLRTTSRAVFDNTYTFLAEQFRDTALIQGDSLATAGATVRYTAANPGIDYRWSLYGNGTIITDSTQRSITVIWNEPSADNRVYLSTRNELGFWSFMTSFRVKVKFIEPAQAQAPNSTTSLLITVIVVLCVVLAYLLFMLSQQKKN